MAAWPIERPDAEPRSAEFAKTREATKALATHVPRPIADIHGGSRPKAVALDVPLGLPERLRRVDEMCQGVVAQTSAIDPMERLIERRHVIARQPR